MGLEMSTGSVRSQLEAMNMELDAVVKNVTDVKAAILLFDGSGMMLKGKAYRQMRETYDKIHMSILKGIVAYVEALRVQNNTYKTYIDGFLSGMEYVNEDELERDKLSLERQISNVRKAMVKHKASYYYLECLTRTLELIDKKLKQIKAFKDASGGLYNGLDSYSNSIKEGIECINNSTFDFITGAYTLGKTDLAWIKAIEDKCGERNKILFYDNLPKNLKLYLGIDDFRCTEDGFFISTKSLENILLEGGLEGMLTIDEKRNRISNLDDWYFSGVVDERGMTTYTFIKIRELGDSEEPGTAVPFIALDIENFDTALGSIRLDNGQLREQNRQVLFNISNDIIHGEGKADEILLNYFRNPASDGSYLIADILIQKTKESNIFDENGNYVLKHVFDVNVSQAQARLKELENLGKR